jgi:hypothetical protein
MTLLKQEGYGNVCFFPCTQNAVLLRVSEMSQFEMVLSDRGHAICRRNAMALLQVLQVDEVGTLAVLALSQRLSPLGLIFRSPTPTSDKINLVNFRISLLKYIELITYYSRHYALSKIALLISFDHELLEL